MAGEPISLDELLTHQDEASSLSTIEAVPDDPDRVMITPFTPGLGCLCSHAFSVPKETIDSVTTTDKVKDCCGKMLMVVEISFADPILNDVYRQISDSARTMAEPRRSAGAAEHESWSAYGGPSKSICQLEHRECVRSCARHYHPNTYAYRRCVEFCDDALLECESHHYAGHHRF
ncbi:hypothetical protein [Streptosporangium sp. KLBMP 9127]|nr:hypothetical protein [Streptosporangium sp. KLBMP 9127]